MRNIKEIEIADSIYPDKLRKINNPPKKIFAIGNLELLNKPSIAIVGTRYITEYGINNCKNFAREITLKEIPIVSGMAIGTDTIAHKTSLEYGGETIAVLGGGFNNIFPKENIKLFDKIIENKGLVITEYAPNIIASSDRFLERNRIVSGISEGVLVIEAGFRSGTSVTAKLAHTQGKIVMALPGRLDNAYGVGVNRLIQQGAKLVTSIEDIIEFFPQFMEKMGKTNIQKQITLWDIKEEYIEIIEILKNKVLSIEEIFQFSKEKNLRNIMNLLINMELEGIIEQEMGKGYRIK